MIPNHAGSDRRVAEMSAAIRQHLGQRTINGSTDQAEEPPGCGFLSEPNDFFRAHTAPIDYEQLLAGLRLVSDYSQLCLTVPGLRRIPWPLRPLARLVARCLLAATRFLFERQRAFNFNTAATLNSLQGVLYYLEQVHTENLRRLEAAFARQQAQMEELTARICDLERERLRAAG